MSWTQKLYETYDNCASLIGETTEKGRIPLLPLCHTLRVAQIEIVINDRGVLKRASTVQQDEAITIIPCTEKSSGGRTSGPAPHPLADELCYVAKDYKDYGGAKKHYYEHYISNLEKWCKSDFSHPKAKAVLCYVNKGSVIKDLVDNKILLTGKDGKLRKIDAFIRWEVEIFDDYSKTCEDRDLWESWKKYYTYIYIKREKRDKTLCYVTGEESPSTYLHPKNIRSFGDNAKIISSNDENGFTFRGRFTDKDGRQVCGVGFEASQKIHHALRWLIDRQGYKSADQTQTIVAWATSDKKDASNSTQDDADMIELFGNLLRYDPDTYISTAQGPAIKLTKKIRGYKQYLGDTTSIVVMGLDSASKGCMAITFYRELTGSEFINRLENWHESCAWNHDWQMKDKNNKKVNKRLIFEGAPTPEDIAEAAYGLKVDNKLKKATVERLLPCIIEGRQVPFDIVNSAVRRACNPISMAWEWNGKYMKSWEWEKTLSIACALYKKFYEKEKYDMALDENRKTRDYLYGRLLAAADILEQFALSLAEEKRATNAVRLMQRFSCHPCSTWKDIENSLVPYRIRLGGRAKKYMDVIDKVMCMFELSESKGFEGDKPLSGVFLLGYHCQREAFKKKPYVGVCCESVKEN